MDSDQSKHGKPDTDPRHRQGPVKNAGSKTVKQAELDLGTDKLYFKIGEVAEIVGVASYVLRYWESEFPALKPQKSRSHQRVYRRRDVELLLKIKNLLYTKKFTIAGAKQELKGGHSRLEADPPSAGYRVRQSFQRVREQFESLSALLSNEQEEDLICADPTEYFRRDMSTAPKSDDSDSSSEERRRPLPPSNPE